MSENAMSWYYSVTLVNVKAILHSAAIVKIIFHSHNTADSPMNFCVCYFFAFVCRPIFISFNFLDFMRFVLLSVL